MSQIPFDHYAEEATTSAVHHQISAQQQHHLAQQQQAHQAQTPSSLICAERLDRSSPDLWPDPVPGARVVSREATSILGGGARANQRFRADLDPEDVRLVNDLGRLTPDQLVEYIRQLHNDAYVLGIEERRQFERGRMLNVFKRERDEISNAKNEADNAVTAQKRPNIVDRKK